MISKMVAVRHLEFSKSENISYLFVIDCFSDMVQNMKQIAHFSNMAKNLFSIWGRSAILNFYLNFQL